MARQYEDTETRRKQVAEAALRTIVDDGVCGFTTRAIASRVGISDGTLFRHFGSKQEIILEAMSHLEARLTDGSSPAAIPCPTSRPSSVTARGSWAPSSLSVG